MLQDGKRNKGITTRVISGASGSTRLVVVHIHARSLNTRLWLNPQVRQSWLSHQPSSRCWIHFTEACPKVTAKSAGLHIIPKPALRQSHLSPSPETDTFQSQLHQRAQKLLLSLPGKWAWPACSSTGRWAQRTPCRCIATLWKSSTRSCRCTATPESTSPVIFTTEPSHHHIRRFIPRIRRRAAKEQRRSLNVRMLSPKSRWTNRRRRVPRSSMKRKTNPRCRCMLSLRLQLRRLKLRRVLPLWPKRSPESRARWRWRPPRTASERSVLCLIEMHWQNARTEDTTGEMLPLCFCTLWHLEVWAQASCCTFCFTASSQYKLLNLECRTFVT